jgi:hydrogenase maturation protease
VLVIGIGNDSRGDDAAGLEVARLADGVPFVGDLSGLLELWSGEDDIVVVDAMRSGRLPGTVVWFDVTAGDPLPPLRSDVSSHLFDLSQAVELARTLGRMPWRLRVVGIEIVDVELGEELSDPVFTTVLELASVLHPAGDADLLLAVR